MLITTRNGLEIDGKFISQISMPDLDNLCDSDVRATSLQPEMLFEGPVRAARPSQGGVPRVHVLNGEVDEGLLAEGLFQ